MRVLLSRRADSPPTSAGIEVAGTEMTVGARWLAAAFVVQTAVLLYPHARDLIVRPETTAYEHGRAIAAELGCFSCHGPEGRGGVPNPGSEWKTVPAFNERVPMMFAKSDAELREYILDGHPRSKANDPEYRTDMEAQAMRMPAYREHLSTAELDALIAFIRPASGLLVPEDDLAARGLDLAYSNGCFSCHGDLGGGGVANPGSFKGYIPSFWGEDFRELVRSDAELVEWIAKGRIERLTQNAIARRYVEGQVIQMPAYEKFLSAEEIDALAAAVRWIHEGSWQNQPLLE
jgi:mono/diheme cytochrome c family protein